MKPIDTNFISLRAPNGYRQLANCQWFKKSSLLLLIGEVNDDTPDSARTLLAVFSSAHVSDPWTIMIVPGSTETYPTAYGWTSWIPTEEAARMLFSILWNELTRMRLNGISASWNPAIPAELAQIFMAPTPSLDLNLVAWDLGWTSCDPVINRTEDEGQQSVVRGRLRLFDRSRLQRGSLTTRVYAFGSKAMAKNYPYGTPSMRNFLYATMDIRPSAHDDAFIMDVAYDQRAKYVPFRNDGDIKLGAARVYVELADEQFCGASGPIPLFPLSGTLQLGNVAEAARGLSTAPLDRGFPLRPMYSGAGQGGNALPLEGWAFGVSLPDAHYVQPPMQVWGDYFASVAHKLVHIYNQVIETVGREDHVILIPLDRFASKACPQITYYNERTDQMVSAEGVFALPHTFQAFVPEFSIMEAHPVVLHADRDRGCWTGRPATWADLVPRAAALRAQLLEQFSHFSVDYVPSGELMVNPARYATSGRYGTVFPNMTLQGSVSNDQLKVSYGWGLGTAIEPTAYWYVLAISYEDYIAMDSSDAAYAEWATGRSLLAWWLGSTDSYPSFLSLSSFNIYGRVCPMPAEGGSAANYTMADPHMGPAPSETDSYASATLSPRTDPPAYQTNPWQVVDTWMRLHDGGLTDLFALRLSEGGFELTQLI